MTGKTQNAHTIQGMGVLAFFQGMGVLAFFLGYQTPYDYERMKAVA